MFYYDRTDLSKGVNVANSNNSRKCIVCHHSCFHKGFKYKTFT